MPAENDNAKATGPGNGSPGHGPAVPAGEPEAPTGPATTSPRAADAARAYSTAEAQVSAEAQADAGAGNGDPAAPAAPAGEAGEAPDAEDHERQLESDLEELSAKAEKADEYLELAKRTKADFENYRKRAARETAAAQDRGIAKLAKELLPAIDNLDRAVQAAEAAVNSDEADQANGHATLVSGVKLVHADVLAALARAGIERYSPKGEAFDPNRHEAIAQQPVDGTQPGTIVEVYQQGYLLGEAVIRPARVVVAG